jgi:hypothetical protein
MTSFCSTTRSGAPLSEGKPCEMQETMEEVHAGASAGAHSEAPRQTATGTHRLDAVPAPLCAPRKRRGSQAVQTAFHREWRKGVGREKFAAAIKRWQQANPEKRRAHWAVGYALKVGKLTKGPCEIGVDCAGRIEAHHDDYSKPLEVRWVCKRHHRQLDAARQAGAA